MGTLHLIFYLSLRLWFLDVETNPGPRRPFAASCEYYAAICGVCPGTLVTWPWLCLSMIYCCSETLVSDLRHVSSLLEPGFGRPVLLCRGKLPRDCGMAAYLRDGNGAFRRPKFECGCCEMLVVRVCGLRQLLCV